MNGFEGQIRENMLGQPHATIKASAASHFQIGRLTEHLKSIPSTLDVSPIIATEVVIQFKEGSILYLDGLNLQSTCC